MASGPPKPPPPPRPKSLSELTDGEQKRADYLETQIILTVGMLNGLKAAGIDHPLITRSIGRLTMALAADELPQGFVQGDSP